MGLRLLPNSLSIFILVTAPLLVDCSSKSPTKHRNQPPTQGAIESIIVSPSPAPSAIAPIFPNQPIVSTPPVTMPLMPPGSSVRVPSIIDRNATIMLIVIGGWNSCDEFEPGDDTPKEVGPRGMNIYRPIRSALDQLPQEQRSRFALSISCFTQTLDSVKIRYEYLEATEKTLPLNEYFGTIIQYTTEQPDRAVALVGHSYGGWYALRLAERLMQSRKLDRLFTVDPISPVRCTPIALGSVILNRAGLINGANPGCAGSFGSADLGLFAFGAPQAIGWWTHLYQQDVFSVLHSAPFPGADQNVWYSHPDPVDAVNGHINMGKDARMWQALISSIR